MSSSISSRRPGVLSVALTLFLNGVLPLLLYVWLRKGHSEFVALLIASALPLVESALYYARFRKLDAFGLLMLAGMVLSMLLALVGGETKLLLLRGSAVTAVIGAAFLCSLCFPRPLMVPLARRFTSTHQHGDFDALWSIPYARRVYRIMTAVWGVILIGEAAVRTLLAWELSTTWFLAVSDIVFYSFIAAAALWTLYYRRMAAKKLALIRLGGSLS